MSNTNPPTIELVIDDQGHSIFEVRGMGLVSRHEQMYQAQLRWHCLAMAQGYDGPAPYVSANP